LRPFRVPGGAAGAWVASGLATGWCVLALVAAVVPGLGTGDPDGALPAGFEGERLAFTACVAIPVVVLGAFALVVSTACARRRRTVIAPVSRA
jgi:glutamate:GABA antiporter